MSTSIHDALAAVGLARTDPDPKGNESASEAPQSKKLSADDFALLQQLVDAFPAGFDLKRPVPLMSHLDAAIRQHPDFRLVSVTALDNVLAFVTGRRPYLLALARKGARRHALDGTPLEPVEPEVRRAAGAELERHKVAQKAAKV